MNSYLKLVVLLALLHSVLCQNGLNSTVATACASSCDWHDPTIWDTTQSGGLPADDGTAHVTFNVVGTYTIQVSSDVHIADFHFTPSSGKVTLVILPGVTFSSSSTFDGSQYTTVHVSPNASFIFTAAGETQGNLILDGSASFGGSEPSLLFNTPLENSNPINGIRATLTMSEGSTLNVTNSLEISAFSNWIGSGTVQGTVNGYGNIYVGTEGAIGQIYINGALSLQDTTDIYVDIQTSSVYDNIKLTGIIFEYGTVYVTTLGKYAPLSYSEFYVFNHTGQRNGFARVTKDCTITCLPGDNKWEALVDQSYTALLYDDATTVLISFATISISLLLTLL